MQFKRKECYSVTFNERSVSLIRGDTLQWEVPLEHITAFGHETTTVDLWTDDYFIFIIADIGNGEEKFYLSFDWKGALEFDSFFHDLNRIEKNYKEVANATTSKSVLIWQRDSCRQKSMTTDFQEEEG